MKPVQPLAVSAVLLLGFAAGAAGQAMVEYGHAAGTSGVAGAAGGKNIGKALGAVFDRTGRTLQTAGQSSATTAAKPAETAKPAAAAAHSSEPAAEQAKPAAALPAVDPAAITPGLTREELLTKFGKPSMQLTSSDGSDQVEKLYYRRTGHETVVVTLRNGKVASVSPPAETAQVTKP